MFERVLIRLCKIYYDFSEAATKRCFEKQFLKYFCKNPLFAEDFKPPNLPKRARSQKHRQ